jgi:membrane protein implicated in regulation of membrane protease activity
MITEEGYQNEYLDRAIAFIVVMVFFIAVFYAVAVIHQFWLFFRWFFFFLVVCLSFWLVVMIYHIAWRYHAQTELIREKKSLPLMGRDGPLIHDYDNAAESTDYNDYFQNYEE